MTTLYNQAYYMLGDQMAAEDITQTVFMKTWQNIETWKAGQAKLITWMRRVTTNACLDQLRKKKPVYSDVIPDIEDTADTPFDACLLYTSPSPRDKRQSRMPSSA